MRYALAEAYENYLRTVQEKIGADFSAPYGVTGTVAAAFGSDGGADQWTMPLSAQQMEDLGNSLYEISGKEAYKHDKRRNV